MEHSHSDFYRQSGVDITAGYEAVRLMKQCVESTYTPGVLSGIGGFGGLFSIDPKQYTDPVLVSGTDGVGTKLRIAMAMDKHDTIGIDCVAMCVNDIICCSAKPLFFLDYIACGHNVPERIASIVSGVAEGCRQAGCALIGGETAEMPDSYPADEYDLAGFAVGIVERGEIPDSTRVTPGCAVIALPSSGLHSNGYSLVRKVFGLTGDADSGILNSYTKELGAPLGEVLLTPTRIYVKAVQAVQSSLPVLGVCNITGGGWFENIPRCLPDGISVVADLAAVKTQEIFHLIARLGQIPQRDMFNTFNMGVGMCMIVQKQELQRAISILSDHDVDAYQVGETAACPGGVVL